ncbi:MAG: aldehyde dehydrogenase family protein [Deltaproteobacteria bacterium]|nr:aldehyde dehydrogenase family protein [Deltaproteobacteria bacterium]
MSALATEGEAAAPRATLAVRDAARGSVFRELPTDDPTAVAEAAARARAAQPAWAALSVKERLGVLAAARRELVRGRAAVLDALAAETGKPRVDVVGELLGICLELRALSKKAARWLSRERVSARPFVGKRGYVLYKPRGLVGVLGPWNAPLHLTFVDAFPALVAGNAVIVKPSEVTPVAVYEAVLALNRVLPPGILQVVVGGPDVGAAVVDHVDLVCVTGSSATGRRVMERAARRLTPVLLELGGNDPMIVLADADLDRAARAAAWGGCLMTGQVCMSVERVYVEEAVAEPFTRKLEAELARLRFGADDGSREVDFGPFIGPRQIEIVERHVADAVERGARVVLGGKRAASATGVYFPPTLLTGVRADMAIMREETFGPVIPVQVVKDAFEAIRHANDCEHGLSASVGTRDLARGLALAERIESGSVWVNECVLVAAVPALPFGGLKQSGVGTRHGGAEGLRQFCVRQAVFADRTGLKREWSWFPYSTRRARLLDALLHHVFGR